MEKINSKGSFRAAIEGLGVLVAWCLLVYGIAYMLTGGNVMAQENTIWFM